MRMRCSSLSSARKRWAPAWPADEANTAVYSAICRRLDRLPLAIELIAVRARTLSPLELLRQLERPLQALVHGPRDVPARHQSLRNAIQWSYDLLDSEEQRVFRCLGVFAGGCTAEAAQAVLGESSRRAAGVGGAASGQPVAAAGRCR